MNKPTTIDLVLNTEETFNRIKELVKDHPPTDYCDDMECLICGYRDCPHNEPLHYHHDGCPACWIDEERKIDNT